MCLYSEYKVNVQIGMQGANNVLHTPPFSHLSMSSLFAVNVLILRASAMLF